MGYQTAQQTRVSVKRAVHEIASHGFYATVKGSYLVADDTHKAEHVAKIGAKDGLVSGVDVLAWLGY